MSRNIKKAIYTLIGLTIVTTLFIFSKLNIANGSKIDGKKFEDWMVSCAPADEKTKTPEICVLNQQLDMTQDDKKQPIALFQIGYFGPKKELKIIEILPLGVRLEAGTSIINSKNLIAPGKYVTCLSTGCQSVAVITDNDLKLMLSSAENSVAFMNIDGQQLSLPLSIKGLKEGLEYLK
ncbi:MAG: invasion associated locus B family protein [Rickettsiales bacterium]|nr:MAG: invasion associated locus B family protein [Rickettsiales bacterium]